MAAFDHDPRLLSGYTMIVVYRLPLSDRTLLRGGSWVALGVPTTGPRFWLIDRGRQQNTIAGRAGPPGRGGFASGTTSRAPSKRIR